MDPDKGHQYGDVSLQDNATTIQGNVTTNNFYQANSITLHQDGGENKQRLTALDADPSPPQDNGGVLPESNIQQIGDANTIFGGRTGNIDVLQQLQFENMNAKKDYLRPEAICDYEWIWSTSFSSWLVDSHEPFWISGKPGSGKSKLVAYLVHCKRTLEKLESKGARFKIIDYFYDHRGGNSNSNNIDGMLRSFLYQLVDKIPEVKSRMQELSTMKRLKLDSTQNLVDNACEALNMCGLRVCTFVDGIDEYADDVLEVVQTCRTLVERTGMKLCIASRPEVRISQTLRMDPHLLMQDHNKASMESYAMLRILQASHYDVDFQKRIGPSTINKIVDRAEGVILWFRLVFDEVVAMHQSNASSEQVSTFVENSRPGLEPLYGRILDLVPANKCQEVATILYVMWNLTWLASVRLQRVGHLDATDSKHWYYEFAFDFDKFVDIYAFLSYKYGSSIGLQPLEDRTEIRSRLVLLLRGLVELYETVDEDSNIPELQFRFIHATFYKYLKDTGWITKHLHPHFKDLFSTWFTLRFAVHCFVEASEDRVLGPEMLQGCIDQLHGISRVQDLVEQDKLLQLAGCTMRALKWLVTGQRSPLLAVMANVNPTWADTVKKTRKSFWDHISRRAFAWATPFELPEKWKAFRGTLMLAPLILQLASHYEHLEEKSSLPIMLPAMHAYLSPWLGFAMFDQGDAFYTAVGRFKDPRCLEIIDLIFAIMAHLPLYFVDRLDQVTLTDHQQQVLGFLVLRHCSAAYWNVNGRFRVEQFLHRKALGSPAFNIEGVCFFMTTVHCVSAAAKHVRKINEFLGNQQIRQTDLVHHDHCPRHTKKDSLLVDWAVMSCRYDNEATDCKDETSEKSEAYKSVLDLVLKTNAKINSPCYPGGTVLNAILDFSLLTRRRHNHNPQLRAKFLALVQTGIDPRLPLDSDKSALQNAREFKRQLEKKKTDKAYRTWLNLGLADVVFIIEHLEFHNVSGEWHETIRPPEPPRSDIEVQDEGVADLNGSVDGDSWNAVDLTETAYSENVPLLGLGSSDHN